jgi:hypothetical protein
MRRIRGRTRIPYPFEDRFGRKLEATRKRDPVKKKSEKKEARSDG